MHNHAPKDYKCPLCIAISGIESPDTMMMQDDIFYRDETVMAAVNSKFAGNNPGHVIIVPLVHYENLYDLPEDVLAHIMKLSQRVALALKDIRKCDGIMLQQNNEPASGQHAFHFHLHVFPRFDNDNYTKEQLNVRISDPSERTQYSTPLREYFLKNVKK